MSQEQRRKFLLTAGALLTVPLAAKAQQAMRLRRIGLIHVGLDHVPASLPTLREGLRALGYEEGRNIRLDFRNLADEAAAHAVAREFVRDRLDLIVAFETQAMRGVKAAASKIPVVFLHLRDPVADGYVASLVRPGGNVTGFNSWPVSPSKQIEIFSEFMPRPRRLLVLFHPKDSVSQRHMPDLRSAAAALPLQLAEREVTSASDIERVLGAADPTTADGVFVASATLVANFTSLVLRLATERRLPLISHTKNWVQQGALFSYATDLAVIGRSAASYVDKILRGANPSDLPVEQPTKFELVINRKTAKALGLTIPQSLLLRADQVIE